MGDQIIANLPSRDFNVTARFYARLGFDTRYRGDAWMIMARDTLEVEFFPHPDLIPQDSWFSASMWLDDIDAMHREWRDAGIGSDGADQVRLGNPSGSAEAPRMFTLHDPDGSLWRVLENTSVASPRGV